MSTEQVVEPIKQEEMEVSAQIEDGELPEDGEIMEDEEEVPVPVAPKSTSNTASSSRNRESSSSKSSKKTPSMSSSQVGRSSNKSSSSKYKDYDSVKTTKQLAGQDAMMNSWVSGVQKKSGKTMSEADCADPNEEYYGVANTSSMREEKSLLGTALNSQPVGGDENDPTGVSTTAMDDKDYRTDEGALDQDGGGFGEDNDYRRMAHSPIRQDRRRRRSSSPTDDYQNSRFTKRQRGDSPPAQLSGRFRRNPMVRPRWAEHTICKFFREGFCRDGDECAYSHSAADSHRRTDLCKYYQHGYCKKGLACLHLHGEYPCKAFHKGECSKEQCQYSHQALDEFTQPIFDQMMRDEELASRISLPSHPLRRKVLLPLGPETSMNETGYCENQTSNDQSFIPPPSVVVPVLSTVSPAVKKTVEDKVMAQTGTYGFFNPIQPSSTQFNPITPVSNSANNTSAVMHQPPHLSPFTLPPSSNNNNSFVLPVLNNSANAAALSQGTPVVTFVSTPATQTSQSHQSSSLICNVKAETKECEPEAMEQDIMSGGFNINQMLEKITQQVNASAVEELEDSPASPPSFFNDTSLFQDTKMIPVVRSWKLYMVDVDPGSPINIDFKQIQSSPSLKNDPRVKKQVESQFDQGTENLKLATSLLLPLPLVGTPTPKPVKPVDPRTKDPRKKAAATTSGSSCIPPPDVDSTKQPTNFEKLVEKQIQMANKLAKESQDSQPHAVVADVVDVDHRPAYGGVASQAHHQTLPSNGATAFAQPSLTVSGFNNTSKFPVPDPLFANLASFELPPSFTNSNFPPATASQTTLLEGSSNYTQHTSYYSEPTDFSKGGTHRGFRGCQRGGNFGYDRRPRDYHNDQHSRWEHPGTSPSTFGTRKHQNGAGNTSPGANYIGHESSSTTSGAAAEVPLTLREKRKNNEYESPLARVTSRY